MKKEFEDSMTDILESVKYNAEEVEQNKSEIKEVRDEMESVRREFEKKFRRQEVYLRRANLLIYGIPQINDTDAAARKVFRSIGVEAVETIDFVNVHRLPRHNTDPTRASHALGPIIVKFVKMADRQRILDASYKNFKMLKETRISIRTDLPVDMKKLRGRLAEKAYLLRKQHKQTRIIEKDIDVFLLYRDHKDSPWTRVDNPDNVKV
jgi:hypothetical protein